MHRGIKGYNLYVGGHEVAWAWRKLRVFAPVWFVRHQRGKSQVNIFYANCVAHSLG